MKIAKKGDYIKIINTQSAGWIKKGNVYLVTATSTGRGNDLMVNGHWWANEDTKDYEIVYRFNDYLKQIEEIVNE